MANRNMDEQRGILIHQTREGMILLAQPSDLFKIGAPTPARIDFAATTTNQEFPLGTKVVYGDREFVYAKAGATALDVGKLMQAVLPTDNHKDKTISTAAIGATAIDFTPVTTAITANEYADGYIHINDDTGEGYLYRIKSHPAISASAAGTLTLYDPIVVATTTGASTGTLVRNRYQNVIIHPRPPTAPVAGVTVAAVAASSYCWLQVKGPCPVLTDGTIVISELVVPSDAINGAVEAADYDVGAALDGVQAVGTAWTANADTEYSGIWLDLP